MLSSFFSFLICFISETASSIVENIDEKSEESGHFSFNESKNSTVNNKTRAEKVKKAQKSAIPTGQVIKLHKYTYNMQFPPYIQKALDTLDIAYPFTQKDISRQYHKLLKENHPDTKNTIQTSNINPII